MRYTKKPVTIEAVRFIGLTDFGDPVFDDAGGLPEWLMEALAGPEGEDGSIWVDIDVIDGKKNIVFGYALDAMPSDVMKSAIPADHWIVRHENGKLSAWDNDLFASMYDPPFGPVGAQAEIAPEIVQVAKQARRSLLLDMQSECIQLRGALAKARDQFTFYAKEHITKAEGFEHKARNAFDHGDAMVADNRAEDAVAMR